MMTWLVRAWRSFRNRCPGCGGELEFGDNIYEDMVDHWYCPDYSCPESELYEGDGERD